MPLTEIELVYVQDDAFQPFDFTTLLKHGIDGHYEALAAISLRASKEAGLERALAAMRADWDGVAFAVVPYKDSGTFVIGGVDDIQALLDDQAVRVAAIRSSPFVAFVSGKASKWAEFVEILQVWTCWPAGTGVDMWPRRWCMCCWCLSLRLVAVRLHSDSGAVCGCTDAASGLECGVAD